MDNHKNNLYWHKPSISVDERRRLNKYKSCVIWFTGLSAAGKSTLANALCEKFHSMHIHGYVLDGDNIRHGLNKDLGFKPEDRKENIRRIGEVAKLLVDAGLVAITAFISPYREDRRRSRELVRSDEFIEVYLKCNLEECERRDPKGVYKKARAGEIKDFTGISAPYEEPEKPEIILDTARYSVDECTEKLLDYLIRNGYIEEKLLNAV
jgi:adenylylsulfate kinase